MKVIRLYGELGKRFGTTHRFAVKSAAEAVRALRVNFKGFEQAMIDGGYFKVITDGKNIGEADLKNPVHAEIKFIPVIGGAGSATGKIILGAVLIVVGAVITYFSAGTAAYFGGALINVGIAFVAGGVVQMLTKPPNQNSYQPPNNQPSYNFNGPVNTTAQGMPVPLCYGRMMVGSAVISGGIAVSQISKAPTTTTGVNYIH